MRLEAQCTVAGAKAQPTNIYLEPAIADGLLYQAGKQSSFTTSLL
jgi:hypothetical protein